MREKYETFPFAILLSVFFSFSRTAAAQEFSPTILDKIILSESRSYKTDAGDAIHLANTSNYDVIYHRLFFNISPAQRFISGTVTTYFRPLSSIDTIAFDMSDSLVVSAVSFHGNPVSFSHSNDQLYIFLPFQITSLDSISIQYSGTPPNSGFGSFVQNYHGDSVPIIWTLSEPYGARDWWPCKNTVQDKIDSLDMFVSVPYGNLAAGNGILASVQPGFPRSIFHWKHRYPIATYLVATAVTNYEQYTDTLPTAAGNITSLNFCYPENKNEWKAATPNTASFISLYTDLFGPYPFIKEKYGHAQFSWGGGEEHQTMSFQVSLDYELDAHELAHQWFGDKLTCNSWGDIWLNEGFATYCSGLCYEHLAPSLWHPFLQGRRKQAFREDTLSVYCTDTTDVRRIFNSAITYSKGALVLNLLRWICGDQQFFSAIRSYVSDPALAYGFSKTKLLQQHLESASGKNLTPIFKDWIEGSGYPQYELLWKQDGDSLRIRLFQSTTGKAVSFFALPIDIQVSSKNNLPTKFVLNNTYSGQTFAVPFDRTTIIDSLEFDPDLWIPSKNNRIKRVADLNDPFVVINPNPFHNEFIIWYDSENIHNASYRLFDINGKKISEGSIEGSQDTFSVSTANLQNGIYIVEFSSIALKKRFEIVKE